MEQGFKERKPISLIVMIRTHINQFSLLVFKIVVTQSNVLIVP